MQRIYFKNITGEIYANIDRIIEKGLLKDKNIILFGMNTSSYVIDDYLKKKNYKIAAYIDNDEKKRMYFKKDVTALSPAQMVQTYGNNIIILIMSKYYAQMKEQLIQLGYQEDTHFIQIIDVDDMERYVDYTDVSQMREITIDELKLIQNRLLKELKKICEKNGLRYYLCGGTLIGAVRHKGYIPWDDDIDVIMPLKDYKQLLRIVNDSENFYKILNVYDFPQIYDGFLGRMTYPNTVMKTWTYPYIESMPVCIDIFPLYGLPKEDEDSFVNRLEDLHAELVKEFIKYPNLTQRYFDIQKVILKQVETYDFDKSENVGYLFSRHKKKEITPRAIYDKTIMVEFEGERYPVAEGYDLYLRNLYGDYMKPPLEENRVTEHKYKVFVDYNFKI